MPQIRPIKDLRNTNKISNLCHSKEEPIFITQNGYGDLVIMSIEAYDNIVNGTKINEHKEILLSREKETKDVNVYSVLENSTIPKEVVKKQVIKNDEEIVLKNNQKQPSKSIKETVKENAFELKFGTKYTNILGFVFIIIAILLLAQYSYVNFETSDLFKTILFYSVGIIILVLAEILNKRGKTVFSIGLTAGAICILFLSTGIAYFYFNIISSLTGIILIILTASAAFLLSIKYDKQIISVFAIVGAYLPVIVLFNNNNFVISALIYFLVCNVFSSSLAFKKRWNILNGFSVILNFLSVSAVLVFINSDREIPFLFIMLYLIVTLFFYVALSLINPIKNNLTLKTNELLLLFMSIAIGTGLCYSQLYAYDMNKYDGAFTIALVIIFYCIGNKLKKTLENRKLSDLMYVVSLFFAILVVPLQLDEVYITTAWLIMAVVLLGYGSYSKAIEFMYAGTVFLILSIISFIFIDASLFKILSSDDEVVYKYTMFTVSCVISLYFYMKNKIEFEKQNILSRDSKLVSYFKLFNIFNVLVYVYYLYGILLIDKLGDIASATIFIVVGCTYVYCLLKTKLLTEKEKEISSNVIVLIMYLIALLVNVFVEININSSTIVIDIICIAIYNLLLLYVASQTINQTSVFTKKRKPVVSVCVLITLILSIMANENVNLGIFNTLIFGVIAFLCILQGLRTLNAELRRFGLGLTIISMTKFFIFDLTTQSTIQKILSYFLFGLILICISYLYQKLLQKYEISSNDIDVNGEKSEEAVLMEDSNTEVEENSDSLKFNEDTTVDK